MSPAASPRFGPLTADTRRALLSIWDLVPKSAYLAGGSGLALHLEHRQSDDLDFFLERRVDLGRLVKDLGKRGSLKVDLSAPDTLNCYLDGTYLQFLGVAGAKRVEPTVTIDGLRVASVGDILAMKLLAVAQRVPPDVKDYVDLWAIETAAGRSMEEGLALLLKRYPDAENQAVPKQVLTALAYFDDLRGRPMPRFLGKSISLAALEKYWKARVPEILKHLKTRQA